MCVLVNDTATYGGTPIVTNDVLLWIEKAAAIIMLVFNIIGVVTNAINIRVFIHQGLPGSSITESFFSLVIADLGCSLLMLPYSVCFIIQYIGLEVMAHNCSTFHVISTWVIRLLFAKFSCCMTVYITLERSLSVIMPLKVKAMFTPRKTIYAVIAIYLVITLVFICRPFPTFRWRYSSKFNQTIAVFYSSASSNKATDVASMISNTITPSFLIVFFTVSLGLMIHKLNAHKEFRQKISGSGTTTTTATNNEDGNKQATSGVKKREAEILKAIALVTGVFLCCSIMSYIPGVVLNIFPGAKL